MSAMLIRDPVTVTLKFERPKTEKELAAAINAMICALPCGADGKTRVRILLEGVPGDMAAAYETGFAIARAQLAAKAKHRRK